MYIPHVLFFFFFFFFFWTEDGRVPSIEVKGLKIDPSEFSTPFPGARNSIPKGTISRPFTIPLSSNSLLMMPLKQFVMAALRRRCCYGTKAKRSEDVSDGVAEI